MTSLRTAVSIYEELSAQDAAEIGLSIGFASAALGEAYHAVGDLPRALAAFRRAVEEFDVFSDREPFFAEKVNALFRLSVLLKASGDLVGAENTLQEAVDCEERLLTFDEEAYIVPLARLLDYQAAFYVELRKFEDALAPLDRGIGALTRFLDCDVALSSRVRAYILLECVYRRRASVFLWRAEPGSALQNLEKALEYLDLALKKGDFANPEREEFGLPVRQIVQIGGMLCDCGAALNEWGFIEAAQRSLGELYERLTPEDAKELAGMRAQLALQLHIALARQDRDEEALAATNGAIAALSAIEEPETRESLTLAKALFQRATFRSNGDECDDAALADLKRAREIFEDASGDAATGDVDDMFYLDILTRVATAEAAREEFAKAMEAWRAGISRATRLLARGRWRRFDDFARLTRAYFSASGGIDDIGEILRTVRLGLRYLRRLRKFYIATNYESAGLDEAPDADAASEFLRVAQAIEKTIVELRVFRAELLSAHEWEDEWARYLDELPEDVRPRPNAKEPGEAGDLKPRELGKLLGLAQTLFDGLPESVKRMIPEPEKDEEPVVARDLETERAAFAKKMAASPENWTIYNDLSKARRVYERLIQNRRMNLADYFELTRKLREFYFDEDAPSLAILELVEATKTFENEEPWRRAKGENARGAGAANDSQTSEAAIFPGPFSIEDINFFIAIFPFWGLFVAGIERAADEESDAERKFAGLDQTLIDDAYRTALAVLSRAGWRRSAEIDAESEIAPFWNVAREHIATHRGKTLASFIRRLVGTGRVKEARALIREEFDLADREEIKRTTTGEGAFWTDLAEAANATGLGAETETCLGRAKEIMSAPAPENCDADERCERGDVDVLGDGLALAV
ncbi:MAG: hypothetical protein HUK22_06125, partial [Thermoguttaceae bacterium]|nr:hypothetical protein [Thermoguttaceae bacterium]